MTLLDVILRAKAATYLDTSMVVMTELEFKQYIQNVIDFRYPSLKVWNEIYQNTADIPDEAERRAAQAEAIADYVATTYPGTPTATIQTLTSILVVQNTIETIANFYAQLTIDPHPDSEEYLYEWWLGVPTGPESCSRDIGDTRSFSILDRSKGDEWDITLEANILNYQSNRAKLGIIPTGYVCTETLRRMRLES